MPNAAATFVGAYLDEVIRSLRLAVRLACRLPKISFIANMPVSAGKLVRRSIYRAAFVFGY